MNRKKKYAVWLVGVLLFSGMAFVLDAMRIISARGGLGISVFWLWSGICLMLDWHPEYRQYDRWERQAYGLATAVMGGLLAVAACCPIFNLLSGLAFVFIPTVLIDLFGRFWYVEKKRSEAYHKKQTEKD